MSYIFDKSNTHEWKEHLDENGYVVLKDILQQQEKDAIFQTFLQEMKIVSPKLDFDNPETLVNKNTPIIFSKGIACFNGFGQSNFMWKLRLNNNIQNIFKHIHNTDELVTSLDGFSLFVSSKQKSNPWLHIDQNPSNNIYSIQGSYNFKPVNESSSGFILIPKSHSKKIDQQVKHSNDWIIMNEQKELMKQSIKLIIPENCFVLWNSKLIHSNTGMKKGNYFDRLTCYITYLPKSLRSETVYKKRQDAYLNSNTTSHWANKCEVKRYPNHFKLNYEKKGFHNLKSLLINDTIPNDRLKLL